MSKSKLSITSKIFYFINIVFALTLFVSYGAYWIPPKIFGFVSILALTYPFLLLVNVLFVVFWLLQLRRQAMLSLVCILLGYNQLFTILKYKNSVEYPENSIKVMGYNVRMLNKYKWIDEEDIPEKIEQLIQGEDPDILGIQEFMKISNPMELSHLPHQFIHYTNSGKNYGLMIASKFPIIDKGIVSFSENHKYNNSFIYTDVLRDQDTLRIINCHLASISLNNEDLSLLETAVESETETIKQGLKTIYSKILKAMILRSQQVKVLREFIEQSPHKILLTGDFNDTPSSYAFRKITRVLDDSFMNTSPLKTKTYIRSHFPIRIDYVMHSKEFRTIDYKIIREELSDHYPVVAQIAL